MITGEMTLNNLTDPELTQVMQAKDRHEGKLFFTLNQVQEYGSPAQPLNNNVRISWNDDDGFHAALELSHQLLGETATLAKIA